jgi:hypothetical protein
MKVTLANRFVFAQQMVDEFGQCTAVLANAEPAVVAHIKRLQTKVNKQLAAKIKFTTFCLPAEFGIGAAVHKNTDMRPANRRQMCEKFSRFAELHLAAPLHRQLVADYAPNCATDGGGIDLLTNCRDSFLKLVCQLEILSHFIISKAPVIDYPVMAVIGNLKKPKPGKNVAPPA